jgi:branched-chain amino acid aminotransferase
LLVTSDGALIDGSTATVWLVSGGVLLTPAAPPAIAGIARGLVFDIAEHAGREAHERPLTLDDFAAADEVFLTNAVGLVAPVRGREGPVTAWIEAEVGGLFSR